MFPVPLVSCGSFFSHAVSRVSQGAAHHYCAIHVLLNLDASQAGVPARMHQSLVSQDHHRVSVGGSLWPFLAFPLASFFPTHFHCTFYLHIGNCSQLGLLPCSLASLLVALASYFFALPSLPFISLHSAKIFFPLGFFNALHCCQVFFLCTCISTAQIVCSCCGGLTRRQHPLILL
jgi:hypothetical protein